ncbi:MAG: holo-ACP synthase [Phycisphaerales bacterium]|nr:holo-ACP synthase [Phycisphaerales bacterium]
MRHGIDIVEVERIAEMRRRHGERFLERCFTPDERAYASRSRRIDEHLAARFAAKEAALKAIGTGWRNGIAWTDVEVVREADGQPRLRWHGMARRIASSLGVTEWSLSMSHTSRYATASVIGVTRGSTDPS